MDKFEGSVPRYRTEDDDNADIAGSGDGVGPEVIGKRIA
jgi:hypothetical protein